MTLAQAHELLKKAHSLPEKTHMDHWRKADAFDKVVHEFDHNVIPATEREYYDMGSTSKDASSHAAHHYREAAKGATDPYDSESLHYSAKEHERKSEGRAREGDPPPVAPYRSFY
jgi:hypothetical protein